MCEMCETSAKYGILDIVEIIAEFEHFWLYNHFVLKIAKYLGYTLNLDTQTA